MSLGSHFVRAVDGKWYEQPVFQRPEVWFLCFDEDEPPELVIRVLQAVPCDDWETINVARIIANTAMLVTFRKEVPMRFRSTYAGRMFATIHDPTRHVMFPAVSFFLSLKDRIPVPDVHAGPVLEGDKPWTTGSSMAATYIDPPNTTW